VTAPAAQHGPPPLDSFESRFLISGIRSRSFGDMMEVRGIAGCALSIYLDDAPESSDGRVQLLHGDVRSLGDCLSRQMMSGLLTPC